MVRIINIDTKTRTIRVSNGKDDLDWFTTDTGSHVPLKKGQSKAEAIKEHFGDKKNDTKRVAAKIYSKLADRVGYVSDSDLEKYLDDNEYFNDDVREEIVKTVRKLESQASERHTEKDAPKPTGKQPAKQDKKSNPQLERLEKMGKAWGKDQMSVLRELGKTNPQGLKDELDRIDAERERTTKAHKEWLKGKADKQQPAKQEPYSDPFHKEAEQKRTAAKDAWLKTKPQVDTKKLRAGDPETFEKYMEWRWQATTLSDGYDEMMKDFGGRDGFNKAAQAYEKSKQPAKKSAAQIFKDAGDDTGWKSIKSGSHHQFFDENNWAQREHEYVYLPDGDDSFDNYARIEKDTDGDPRVVVTLVKDGERVYKDPFDGYDDQAGNMQAAIEAVARAFGK
jgi:hypothetical protein